MSKLSEENLELLEEAKGLLSGIHLKGLNELQKNVHSIEGAEVQYKVDLIAKWKADYIRLHKNTKDWICKLHDIQESWEFVGTDDKKALRYLYHEFRVLISDMHIRLGNVASSADWSSVRDKLAAASKEVKTYVFQTDNE